MTHSIADPACLVLPESPCATVSPANAQLCGYSAEQYAETALLLEPRGYAWCKQLGTVKAALYRAFGRLLADFDKRMCDLFEESRACGSVELLGEWENEYGLPAPCMTHYPQDLAGRQAMVCAARRATGISTMAQLEALLQTALNCPYLRLETFYTHSLVSAGMGQPLTVLGGVCVRGIGPNPPPPYIHNIMGGSGFIAGTNGTTAPYGSSMGQPLTLIDPNYVAPPSCPIVYHSTMGGWTGGMGRPLTVADPVAWSLLNCLMQKHLPAHVAWTVCD